MRGTRWLLLVVIAAIVFGVGLTYRKLKILNEKSAIAKPAALPENISATYDGGGVWTSKDQKTGCADQVSYKGMRQAADNSHSELTGVELRIFHKTGDQCDSKFDLIKSDAATFFESEGRLYADGQVHIVLGEPSEGTPPPSLISITSSGVNFDTNSGKADTDRPASFVFKNGDGHATGAQYDPATKDVFLKKDVVLDWEQKTPNAKPLHIEAPSGTYHEATAEIDLMPTGKVTRDAMVAEGNSVVIHLIDDGEGHKFVREITAASAHGVDVTPGRKLAYAADSVVMQYNDAHVIEHIIADGRAALTSTSETAETHVAGNHVEMFFEPQDKESVLSRVTCDGNAVATSRPLPTKDRQQLPDSHTLRSEHIAMKMRSGGRDIESLAARPSGTLEFTPNQPTSHHRTLVGNDMLIAYAPQNRIETFHATNVKTTTDPNAQELKDKKAVSTTSSRDFMAKFDPLTNQLLTIDETGDFAYQQGDKKARAVRASFDQKRNVMVLDSGVTVSDATGNTSADHIRLDQNTDDFVADGNVKSIKLPDKDQKNGSALLSGDSPMNAQANRMESSNRKGSAHTRYEGNARLWQGANRISADLVEIDRDKHTMVADGHVITEAWEQPKDDAKKKSSAPVQTVVNAPHMVYTDTDRLAYYTGGVKLTRTDLNLKSRELHAWLADSKADSQLEKAFADGAVEIAGARKENSYTGNSEHLEYYTKDQKVVLNGGTPQLVRTVAGKKPTVIKEQELIYSIDSGNLKGNGAAIDRLPPKK